MLDVQIQGANTVMCGDNAGQGDIFLCYPLLSILPKLCRTYTNILWFYFYLWKMTLITKLCKLVL